MHIDRRFVGWGVFFVVLGAVPLAVREGVITAAVAGEAWNLWPLILIGIGIGLLLRRTPFEWVGGIVVAATLGGLLGAGLATGIWRFGSFGGCGSDASRTRTFDPVEGTLGGEASVSLSVDCGDLTLAPAAGAGYRLDGSDQDGRGPIVMASSDSLEIRPREGGGFFGGARETWRMSLGSEPTMRVDVSVNAGSATLDLASMRVPTLTVSANASDATIDMSAVLAAGELTASANAGTVRITLPVRDLRGSVSANAGSIELCAPPNVGLRFHTDDSITASYDFGAKGLVKVGDAWETPGYANAEVRIELDASANAGSISLDPKDGCRG
jgi:hypothetical protein